MKNLLIALGIVAGLSFMLVCPAIGAEYEKVSLSVQPYYVWNAEAAVALDKPAPRSRNPNELGLAGTFGYEITKKAGLEVQVSRGLDSKLTRIAAGVSFKVF